MALFWPVQHILYDKRAFMYSFKKVDYFINMLFLLFF